MRIRERDKAGLERFLHARINVGTAKCLSGDGLHDRKRVLHAMVQLVDKERTLLFGFEALGNIGVGTEPMLDTAMLIADRQRPRKKPPVLALFASERKRVFPRLARIERMPDFPNHPVDVIWMMDFLPAPTLHFLKRRAGVIKPTLIVPVNPTRGVGHPGELAHVIGKRPELPLPGGEHFSARSRSITIAAKRVARSISCRSCAPGSWGWV